MAVAERVRKLQGKETAESPVESSDESENEELFKKYMTSSGLKEKNIEGEKKVSPNTMIGTALLVVAFIIGAGFGIYILNIPEEASSVSLFTNDSAFPPYIANNTTNMTNTTNTTKTLNTTKPVNTTVTTTTTTTKPIEPKPEPKPEPEPKPDPTPTNGSAGDPNNQKTAGQSSSSGNST